MDLIKQYELETGKSAWQVKDYLYTDEYSKWVKDYIKTSPCVSAKILRDFAKKLKDE